MPVIKNPIKAIRLLLSLLILIPIFSNAQRLIHSEFLGRPTDKSITLQAFFDSDVEMNIAFGTSSGSLTNQTPWQSFTANAPAEIVISGLKPNTKYYYRMQYRLPLGGTIISRPEYTFQTQRAPGNSFSFVVQADPHLDEQSDTAIYSRCLRNQLEDAPDFMIDLGDFLMTDKLRNSQKQVPKDTIPFRCNLLRNYYGLASHSVPVFIALGNHEGEAGWNLTGNANNIAVWGTQERKKYFLNPAPDNFYTGDTTHHPFVDIRENYYSWTWGDALFIVIDPYWYTKPKPDSLNGWRWTLGKTQYDWLKTTLENSNAKFKFVFSHQIIGGDPDGRGGVEFANLYEWGGSNLDGTPGFAKNRPGWYKPIKDLLEEHRVTIFFHGHDHFFGKQEKNCLIYQETPQPSHPNFSNVNFARDYGYKEGVIQPNSGHIRVTVNDQGVKVEYVRVYLPKNETANRHNKDVSASYYIGATNCYDSVLAGTTMLWNSQYSEELIYPNPFYTNTKIEFSVTQPDQITLEIYNQQGQLIKTLLKSNPVNAGRFEVLWDGTDAQNNLLANGTYYYQLSGKNRATTTGKLILNH